MTARGRERRRRRRERVQERRALMRGRRAVLLKAAQLQRQGSRLAPRGSGGARYLVSLVEVWRHTREEATHHDGDGRGFLLEARMGGLMRGFCAVHRYETAEQRRGREWWEAMSR